MGRSTSVFLGVYFKEFIQHRIKEERYRNASEVITAGLRLID
ncbi:MAG: hypothetical protein HKN68_21210 [Saprospiraceae bacterium]|nr:hypothetical protein [Saprospiraceae bacterium]